MTDTAKPIAVRVDYGVPAPCAAPRRRGTAAGEGPSVLADVLGWSLGAGVVLLAAGIAAQEVKVGADRPAHVGPSAPAMAAGRPGSSRVSPAVAVGASDGAGSRSLR